MHCFNGGKGVNVKRFKLAEQLLCLLHFYRQLHIGRGSGFVGYNALFLGLFKHLLCALYNLLGYAAQLCNLYAVAVVRAAARYARDYAEGRAEGELTEERFGSYLYSAGIPDPDLLIRPGGEQRISNFLLWQCAYSEFYFTDVLWPDFGTDELDKAIAVYNSRDRRYGGVKNP